MSNMKDMYRLTRFVYSDQYNPPAQLSTPKAAEDDCIKQYSQKRHLTLFWQRVSTTHATHIMRNAIKEGFIEAVGDNTPAHNGHRMWVVAGKGMQLISKDWGRRKGLSEQTMQMYPNTKEAYAMKYKARLAIGGAFVGAGATIAAAVIKGLLKV
jgi:hypothetical protein